NRGSRRMPLAEFIVGNRKTLRQADEILTAVLVPRDSEGAATSFLKLGARQYLVISIAMVAVLIRAENDLIQEARVAVGACSVRAQRVVALEKALTGVRVQEALSLVSANHLSILSPIDDVRATGSYRKDAALTLVRRALRSCLEAV